MEKSQISHNVMEKSQISHNVMEKSQISHNVMEKSVYEYFLSPSASRSRETSILIISLVPVNTNNEKHELVDVCFALLITIVFNFPEVIRTVSQIIKDKKNK